MKRSEMLELLKKHMDEDIGRVLDDTEADHILSVLEEAGMMPPNAELKIAGDVFYDNYWEPEEEQITREVLAIQPRLF